MAILVTNIGVNANNAGTTVTKTAVTVPAGSLIFCCAEEFAGAGNPNAGVFSDTVNTYHALSLSHPNGLSSNGATYSAYVFNSIALSGGTITCTKGVSGANTSISLFYATGVQSTSDPLDTAVTNTATGSSASPSVAAAGTAGAAGELNVGVVGWDGTITDTFTQDTTNATWAAPPTAEFAAQNAAQLAGGSVVNITTSALTYNPTITSRPWAALICAFKAADAGGAPQLRTTHTPTTFRRFTGNVWDTGVPQPETNPHFIGRHTPRAHLLQPALRQNYPTADVVRETNVNFLGRFSPVVLARLVDHRQNYPTADVVSETNTHTIGQHRPVVYARLPGLWQNYPTADVVITTNVHMLGRHVATRHQVLPALRQNYPTADVVQETNVYFQGRFAPTNLRISSQYRQNPATDTAAETNTNFLGRFAPPTYAIFRYSLTPLDVPPPTQPETNPHFIGRFKAAAHARFPYNVWDTSTSQPETNVSTIGRFIPTRIVTLALHRQNAALDLPPTQPETNPHTLGRFAPPQHKILAGHRQNIPTADVVRETNVHTLGRFSLRAHFISPPLRQNPARDVQNQAEPHTRGRHTPTTFLTLPGLRQNVPNDIFVPFEFDEQPHTIGRYAPTRFNILQSLFRNPALDFPPVPPVLFGLAFVRDFAVWSAPAEDAMVEPQATAQATDSALWSAAASSMGSATVDPMGPYQIQTSVELQGSFTGANGQNADPTTVTLYLEDPDGNETTYTWPVGQVVRAGIGSFTFIFTPAISGNWTYKWQGTGAVVATSADTQFEVVQSALIPG